MRAWGVERQIEEELAGLDGELERLLQAYANGVNQALRRHLPVEYRLLGVEPEPWRIGDTFAVGFMVGWAITHNWRHELCRLLLALELGPSMAERVFPSVPWSGKTSLANRERIASPLPPAMLPQAVEFLENWTKARGHRLFPKGTMPYVPGGASNGWVVGGARSVSGKPLLAGDPHLPHMLPSIVFQQHLSAPGMDVVGVTVPGIPYVLMGHNERVAWTLTAAVADVTDLYIEKQAGNGLVLGPSGPEPVTRREEVIRVRQDSGFTEKRIVVRSSRRGTFLNDIYPKLLSNAPLLSIRSLPLGAAESIVALRRAASARNVDELRDALSTIASPVNVVTAADVEGNVALFPVGKVPLRRGYRGTFPVPSWTKGIGWEGTLPFEQMPAGRGGPEAVFAHSNNLLLQPEHQSTLFQVDSAPSYRLERILELIDARKKHDLGSFAAIQRDVFVGRAKKVLPPLLEGLEKCSDTHAKRIAGLLRRWDGRASADSTGASAFFVLWRQAVWQALSGRLSEPVARYLLSFRYFGNAADLWFADERHPVWDDPNTEKVETGPDVWCAAASEAYDWLRRNLGADEGKWRWGRLHVLERQHPFGGKVPAFNLEPVDVPGGMETVWKAQFEPGREEGPFRARYGPVMRMLVDLADIYHARWIVDTGTSGWPLTEHYGDQAGIWLDGDTIPMLFDWPEITAQSPGYLLLSP